MMKSLNYKPYSKELNKENDMPAKILAVDFLETFKEWKLDTPLEEQPERYKRGDFMMSIPVLIEVERKKGWIKSKEWQGWNTVDVAYRKKNSKSHYFIMANEQCDTIIFSKMSAILNSPVKVKDTKYTKQEKFFAVNPSVFKLFYREEDCWYEGKTMAT